MERTNKCRQFDFAFFYEKALRKHWRQAKQLQLSNRCKVGLICCKNIPRPACRNIYVTHKLPILRIFRSSSITIHNSFLKMCNVSEMMVVVVVMMMVVVVVVVDSLMAGSLTATHMPCWAPYIQYGPLQTPMFQHILYTQNISNIYSIWSVSSNTNVSKAS